MFRLDEHRWAFEKVLYISFSSGCGSGLTQHRIPAQQQALLDISARSALTIHRGTANQSNKPRPALVLGVDAPGAINHERHDLQLTKTFFETLPQGLQNHLTYRLVDELEPIVQAHSIEGLMMGEA